MLLHIDASSDIPIYEQIANGIILGIASGRLHEGFNLPSVRSLASDLSINMHTVNKAYKYLQDLGYLILQPKKGAVIQISTSKKNNPKEELQLAIAKYLINGNDPEIILKEVSDLVKQMTKGD